MWTDQAAHRRDSGCDARINPTTFAGRREAQPIGAVPELHAAPIDRPRLDRRIQSNLTPAGIGVDAGASLIGTRDRVVDAPKALVGTVVAD